MKKGKGWLRKVGTGVFALALAGVAARAGVITVKTNTLELVHNGQPVSTIVVARDNCSYAIRFAAYELQEHIRKITGATLPIATDDEKAQGARILVGESAASRKLGLKSEDFKSQEYLIRFLPDTLILMGRDEQIPPIEQHGNVKWVEGKFGKALGFDGVDDVVTAMGGGFSDEEGTVEMWVWLPAQPQEKPGIIFKVDDVMEWNTHGIERVPNTSRIKYQTYDHKSPESAVISGELAEGWHHLMATHSVKEGKIALFVDGISQGTAPYMVTKCGDARLTLGGGLRLINEEHVASGIGGLVLINPFRGRIDEICISKVVRKPGNDGARSSYAGDGETTLLMHCDEEGTLKNEMGFTGLCSSPPGNLFQTQGTCYAVYDFLERFCGTRWYAPGEIGLVYSPQPTLEVSGAEIRRSPAIKWRHPCQFIPDSGKMLWDDPTASEKIRFWFRQKAGGEKFALNHSFSGYYHRFWKKNFDLPDRPAMFEEEHPEYFAQGYPNEQPSQMCYSNPKFIQQVVQDARDYFDGKGLKPDAVASGDYFALVPMDNWKWCKCPVCQEIIGKGGLSGYIFGFVNNVAREVKKTHPAKFISAAAYAGYRGYPQKIQLESNVAVQLCLMVRNFWCPSEERHMLEMYQSWIDKEKGKRPLYVWLYYCYPELEAESGKFNCFPGFFAHTAARQIKMFARDGIQGAFLNPPFGPADQADLYITFKLFDDPGLDVDVLLDEFFTRYYGNAGGPIKAMYLEIERIYSDPANYPEAIKSGDYCMNSAQTEEIAWGYLGTEERLTKLGKLMADAKAATTTGIEKKRVALWEKNVWDYMVAGRKQYLSKSKPGALNSNQVDQRPEEQIRKQKAQLPPAVCVPRITAAAIGDPQKVEWSKAVVLDKWRTVVGEATDRKVTARLAHDGEYLYVRLEECMDTAKLVGAAGIWAGDDWEIFFAEQRGQKPYRQIGINPEGKHLELEYGAVLGKADADRWDSEVKVVSEKSADRWAVMLAFPLKNLPVTGVWPGRKLYANFYRATPEPKTGLAWSPNFEVSFHKLDRLGELTLE